MLFIHIHRLLHTQFFLILIEFIYHFNSLIILDMCICVLQTCFKYFIIPNYAGPAYYHLALKFIHDTHI